MSKIYSEIVTCSRERDIIYSVQTMRCRSQFGRDIIVCALNDSIGKVKGAKCVGLYVNSCSIRYWVALIILKTLYYMF